MNRQQMQWGDSIYNKQTQKIWDAVTVLDLSKRQKPHRNTAEGLDSHTFHAHSYEGKRRQLTKEKLEPFMKKKQKKKIKKQREKAIGN